MLVHGFMRKCLLLKTKGCEVGSPCLARIGSYRGCLNRDPDLWSDRGITRVSYQLAFVDSAC